MNKKDFKYIKEKISGFYSEMLAPPKDGDDPEGIYNNIISKSDITVKSDKGFFDE